MDFSKIATDYEKFAKVQSSASELLLDLLKIGKNEDVLDLGCGTGKLTRKLRELTGGRIVGVDASKDMIEEAKRRGEGLDITFEVRYAEEIEFAEEFDIIVCNSAFQWFKNPKRVLLNCFRALRHGGRMGVQAPATKNYCPTFLEALGAVEEDKRTSEIFSHFKSPWFFLEHENEYRRLFERAGFDVKFCRILRVETHHSGEEVFKIFLSGAAAAYLNPQCYSTPITDEYRQNFLKIVKEELLRESRLIFNRLYLVAFKPSP